jgi:lipopolysaccharide transport system permease protein
MQRYRGSYLGTLWALIIPLLMLGIYTFVFSMVLQAKWETHPTAPERVQFALTLFAGLIPFTVFSEVLNRAPTLILQVPNYVKKVVFPLEILPLAVLNAALVHSLISIVILMVGIFLCLGIISPMIVFLPLAYVPLILLCAGLGWFLASLGVYVRDIGQSIGFIVQVLFFMSPIFYPVTAVPEPFRMALYLNPLTVIVENFRRLLLWRQPLAWQLWALWTLGTAILALLGYIWFRKTQEGFADVM